MVVDALRDNDNKKTQRPTPREGDNLIIEERKKREKQFFFQLSGIHPTLPAEEIKGILLGEEYEHAVLEKVEQGLLIECTPQAAFRAAWRAGYCRRAVEILLRKPMPEGSWEDLVRIIARAIDFNRLLKEGESYVVRVHRIKNAYKKYSSIKIEPALGKLIGEELEGKCRAEMTAPDHTFVVLFREGEVIFGEETYKQPKGSFTDRRPDRRPFFKPGTLDPRFARLMTNLAEVGPQGILLDPFCGPGGILVEGVLMDCPIIGTDIDEQMIRGAKKNLEHFAPQKSHSLVIADARALPFQEKITAIATDPPYGRSTSTFGKAIERLLRDFLEEAKTVLVPGGTVVIGMFAEVPLATIVEEAGLELILQEEMYIHRSLTRRIGVCKKK
ncbi:MAG: methyltransferase domain-containing protein [Candidatus Heimdallarchaeota archaeon]|nr:methyltransferase domain-containing protein [Candidatus Heimdallarchaeota archaeon]